MTKLPFNTHQKKIAARLFAAIFLGFILTNTLSTLIGFLLPSNKLNAVFTATLLSFVVYTLIVVWIFHTPHTKRMLLVLFAAIIASSAASALLFYLEVH